MTASIPASELLINPDGSIFHLHLLPEDLAEDIILVGDPGRVETIASHFDRIELQKSNREFCTVTGSYKGHRFSVISTGIGPDNIDIVMNELDALANIDLQTKEVKPQGRTLNIVRIGTSGAVQADIPVNSFVISEKSIGCDGVLRFYANNESVCDSAFEDTAGSPSLCGQRASGTGQPPARQQTYRQRRNPHRRRLLRSAGPHPPASAGHARHQRPDYVFSLRQRQSDQLRNGKCRHYRTLQPLGTSRRNHLPDYRQPDNGRRFNQLPRANGATDPIYIRPTDTIIIITHKRQIP